MSMHVNQPFDGELTITEPDDWHLHLRDGDAMRSVVPHSAAQFTRAIIMPNLSPKPVTTAAMALAYRERILEAVPDGMAFVPLMTLYLTDNLPPDEIKAAKDAGVVAVKTYPKGGTTNSENGVTDFRKTYKTLEMMQREGILLLIHGEVTDPDVDFFDREAVFIDRKLVPLRRDFPELKIVLEHATTKEAVSYVRSESLFTAASLTAHHLLFNRNVIFTIGDKTAINPHYWCMPALKREKHRQALIEAATSGDPRFFAGTDSAPHPSHAKMQMPSCAGCYTAHAAMEMYAEAFEKADALEALESFTSFHGADFYGLPRNLGTVTLKRESWQVPESYAFGEATVTPLRADETLEWKLVRG